MNPFVNPKKRSISLLPGCKNLADVLGRPQLAAKSPIRRFITLVLMQAEQDCATELVIGVEPEGGEGTAIKYKVEGCWYDMSPFPSGIRARVVSELGRMAGWRKDQYPQDGVLSVAFAETKLLWRVRIATQSAECVLTNTDV